MPTPAHHPLPALRQRLQVLPLCLGLSLAALLPPALAAGQQAHEHGALKLDIAIDGHTLSIEMEAPLDNLLGFERAPRTAAERKAAAQVMARLRSPGQGKPLLAPDVAAQCTLSQVDVEAPVLEPAGAGKAKADDHGHSHEHKHGHKGEVEHADLDAHYTFTCAQPDQLRSLDVGLFEAYSRIRRIDVQVAGPSGQSKLTLKRPARTVPLAK